MTFGWDLPEEGDGLDGAGEVMRELVVEYLREEGEAAVQAGNSLRAESYLQRALALDGEDAELWVLLGAALPDRGAREVCARQALALDPTHPRARDLLEQEVPVVASEPAPPAPVAVALPVPAPSLPSITPPILDQRLPTASPAPRAEWQPQLRFRLVAAAILLLAMLTNGLLARAYNAKYRDRIYTGVQVGGLDVGGFTLTATRSRLQQEMAPFLKWPVQLRYGSDKWLLTAGDLGLRYRIDEALQEAWTLGREGPTLRRGWERLRIAVAGRKVELQAEIDDARRRAALDRIAAVVDRPAVPPVAGWQDGKWAVSPGQDGRHLNRAEAERQVAERLTALVHGDLSGGGEPMVIDLPVVTDTAVLPAAQADELRAQLERVSQPLELRFGEDTWSLEPADIAPWIQISLAPAPDYAQLSFDWQGLQDYLVALAPQIDRPVVQPRMEIQNNRVVAFQQGQDGRRLDQEAMLSQVETAFERRLNGEDVEAVDVIVEIVPAGDDQVMQEMGVLELVGEGTSTFVGCNSDRAWNVMVGGIDVHGRLIAPGEVFSLNDALDPITWEKGYRLSAIIGAGGYVYEGLGGGLCQLATTLFRAALNTGLEIVERQPHLWRVEWYEQDAPPGFDSTIFAGSVDLKFRNNTGHYLLIQVDTRLDEGRQTVRFYGTNPHWNVTIDNIQLTNGGHSASFDRTVKDGDGNVLIQETIYSYYQ